MIDQTVGLLSHLAGAVVWRVFRWQAARQNPVSRAVENPPTQPRGPYLNNRKTARVAFLRTTRFASFPRFAADTSPAVRDTRYARR